MTGGVPITRAGVARTIPWADLDDVVLNPVKDTALARRAGGTLSCTLKVAKGGNVTITGLTQNGEHLVEQVQHAYRRTQGR
ncbi:hypothetical protein [Actinophytocola sediminis]